MHNSQALAKPAAIAQDAPSRPRWILEDVLSIYDLPFMDLLWQAQRVHRQHFNANEIQRSTLVSLKTGGCSENCGYCSQSAHHETHVQREPLMTVDNVLEAARRAKAMGASRFCMGAAWRGPKEKDLERVAEMIREVRALGLETCATLGMVDKEQAETLKEAGLDYYNHNLDTDAEYYPNVVGTHSHADRLTTIDNVVDAGIKVCSGGIVGMGETRRNRAALLAQLANMTPVPDSVPINNLVPVPGTPLGHHTGLPAFEVVRTIATARIVMPTSHIRLAAGRDRMSGETQALCFLAGANSVFYGDALLTTPNPQAERDDTLFRDLGLTAV